MSNIPRIKADLRAHWQERRAEAVARLAEAKATTQPLVDAGLGEAADIYVKGLEAHVAAIDKALDNLKP